VGLQRTDPAVHAELATSFDFHNLTQPGFMEGRRVGLETQPLAPVFLMYEKHDVSDSDLRSLCSGQEGTVGVASLVHHDA
jgi:hypothetical protein